MDLYLGPHVHQQRDRPDRHRHIRLLRGERPRHRGKAGANIHSLFIQDAWTVGSRLTINLGLRTENENDPVVPPDIAKYAFEFGFGDKLAPRLGATYDVRGDGR